MLYGYPLNGLTVIIRNTTSHKITDLVYTFTNYPETKVENADNDTTKQFLIINSHIKEEQDLIFYFKNNKEKKFIFNNVIKPLDKSNMFTYAYYKIIECDKQINIVIDEEGKELYFK